MTSMRSPESRLSHFFTPKSVAVIGASATPGKIGNNMVRLLTEGRKKVRVFPVNRDGASVCGVGATTTLAEVPDTIDLAILAVPARSAVQAAVECCAKGVGAVIVLSSGFGEAGDEGGALQKEVADLLCEHEIPFLGPNCAGTADFHAGFIANFSPIFRTAFHHPGRVSIVAQSGGFASTLYERLRRHGIGIAKVVTTGNEAGVSSTELISFLGEDPDTHIIVSYMEQVRDARRFVAELPAVTRRKPVIVEKVGRTESGARAATSHTAAMAGSARASAAAMHRAGVLSARSLEDVVDLTCGLLAAEQNGGVGEMGTDGVAILSQGGGFLVELADLYHESGLAVPKLSADVQSALRNFLPDFAAVENPVDFTAALLSHPEWIPRAAALLEADGAVGALTLALSSVSETEGIEHVIETARQARKPLLVVRLSEAAASDTITRKLHDSNVIAVESTRAAAVATKGIRDYTEVRSRDGHAGPSGEVRSAIRNARERMLECVARARSESRSTIMEYETKEILEALGIAGTRERLITSRSELRDAAAAIGFPVVLKVMSPQLTHKSDHDAVRLGCRDLAAAAQAYDELIGKTKPNSGTPQGDIRGILIAEHCEAPLEAIVGVQRDPDFGPLIVCGVGGTVAELVDDVSVRLAPVTIREAGEMIEETRLGALLEGWRGRSAGDRHALTQALYLLSHFACDVGDVVRSIDLNPIGVMAAGDGIRVMDASMWCS